MHRPSVRPFAETRGREADCDNEQLLVCPVDGLCFPKRFCPVRAKGRNSRKGRAKRREAPFRLILSTLAGRERKRGRQDLFVRKREHHILGVIFVAERQTLLTVALDWILAGPAGTVTLSFRSSFLFWFRLPLSRPSSGGLPTND